VHNLLHKLPPFVAGLVAGLVAYSAVVAAGQPKARRRADPVPFRRSFAEPQLAPLDIEAVPVISFTADDIFVKRWAPHGYLTVVFDRVADTAVVVDPKSR
jgi:hypothetical protein